MIDSSRLNTYMTMAANIRRRAQTRQSLCNFLPRDSSLLSVVVLRMAMTLGAHLFSPFSGKARVLTKGWSLIPRRSSLDTLSEHIG